MARSQGDAGLEARPTGDHDELVASPRGRRLLAVLALLAAVFAVPSDLAILLGPLGMVLGTMAHVKGDRLGMPAAVLAGITTVVGMTFHLFLN